jgi:hypothetical protein
MGTASYAKIAMPLGQTLLYNIPEREMPGSGQRTGIANLPLHYGKVPPWLFRRMCQLAREIAIVTVAEFSTEEIQ